MHKIFISSMIFVLLTFGLSPKWLEFMRLEVFNRQKDKDFMYWYTHLKDSVIQYKFIANDGEILKSKQVQSPRISTLWLSYVK